MNKEEVAPKMRCSVKNKEGVRCGGWLVLDKRTPDGTILWTHCKRCGHDSKGLFPENAP